MADDGIDLRLLQLFAELLDYPRRELGEVAGECAARLTSRSPEGAAQLRAFETFARNTPPGRMEEIYAGVFELDATCHPYVGYQLFGESYKRSQLLLELKGRYRPYGIEYGSELPDHLAVMLRFLAANEDTVETEEIIREALHPALSKMLKRSEDDPPEPGIPRPPAPGDEYRRVLQALQSALLTMVMEPPAEEIQLPVAGD